MPTYSIRFECVNGLRTGRYGDKFPHDYSFWEPVMRMFVTKCESFSLECKLNDKESIASASKYGARDSATLLIQNMAEVWEGVIDEHFIYELFIKPFDSDGKIKWHTVCLKCGGKVLLSACKYGTEFGAHGLTGKEVETVASYINKEHFSFLCWEDVKSGSAIEVNTMIWGNKPFINIFKKK